MTNTNELRGVCDLRSNNLDYWRTTARKFIPQAADEIDQLRTTLQHATEDKAKTLAALQQLHMKRADPHNTQELLEFYLEAHLLIRNLLNGVPMEADNRG